MNEKEMLSRRSFLQGATAGTLVFALGMREAAEAAEKAAKPEGPPVGCGVIGIGSQGRAILAELARLPGAKVTAICDNFPAALRRAQREAAPEAMAVEDYRKLLESKEVAAVFVATPTHLHRAIVLDALQAGKHVYCEAPLAASIDEAREIARAGKSAKTVFQAGQQHRANPLFRHALKFVTMGALGQMAQVRAQWHRKDSWRRAASTPERERDLNWRLYKETSPGLVGEVGVHQVDAVSWALRKLPLAVHGFGGVLQWREDDRTVPDTIQCVFEYPDQVRLLYDATLANSFDGVYQLFMGSDAAILLRDNRGWMIKEADAPQIGWEVYAHKEKIGDELGITLIADSTKILAAGGKPGETAPEGEKGKEALYYALESFLTSIREGKRPACGPEEGFQAAVTVLKANEAILGGTKIVYQKEWFDL